MNTGFQTIKKSISLNASKEKVWDVLLLDKYTRSWYESFSEGSHAETDWQLGSKAIFKDNSNSGIIGTVVVNRPYEVISIEYSGVFENGQEIYDNEMAKSLKGSRETYRISEKDGQSQLYIEVDMSEKYFDMMSAAWDTALDKIKEFAEK